MSIRRVTPVWIAPVSTVEELRTGVVNAVNQLVQQINKNAAISEGEQEKKEVSVGRGVSSYKPTYTKPQSLEAQAVGKFAVANFDPQAADLIPDIDNRFVIGTAGRRWQKVHCNTIAVASGATAGYVLTCTNSDGDAQWQAAGGGNTPVSTNASGSLTLSTASWADVTGASVSLATNGTYLVLGNFCFYKDTSDTECQGRLLTIEGTSTATPTGIVRLTAASTNSIRANTGQNWIVTVTNAPMTAKLQATKVAGGTGASTSDITNTSLTAVFLTP